MTATDQIDDEADDEALRKEAERTLSAVLNRFDRNREPSVRDMAIFVRYLEVRLHKAEQRLTALDGLSAR
jgi:hypothetical protein